MEDAVTAAQEGRGAKVALVSVGLGRVQRGFERYFSDLFGVLRDRLDVSLYKGGGTRSSREKIPPLYESAMKLARTLPLQEHAGGPNYKQDCLAFGATLLPELLRRRYDVIHCIDPPLAKVLQRLQEVFRFRTRILFTEGAAIPPEYYPRVAHIHHVARSHYVEAVEKGVPESHMTLVPCGLHTERFVPRLRRAELRRKYQVPETTFVILAVSAVKRAHKRMDYLIEEVSHLEGDILLWIDGSPEDLDVVELARRTLGSRCRFSHVPSDEIAELYSTADVLVHASLVEAFGLAIVEALCSGLMVLAHDSPHFGWLIQDQNCLVDMSQPGNLTSRLRELSVQKEHLQNGASERAASVRQRFDWRSLAPDYVSMYRKVAGLSPGGSNGYH